MSLTKAVATMAAAVLGTAYAQKNNVYQRGKPFFQPQNNVPNPSTERNIYKYQPKDSTDPNAHWPKLNYISCDDDLGWIPFTDVTKPDYKAPTVENYLKSVNGSRCHCPRTGRWEGQMTNGTWFWDYTQEDWQVNPGVNGKAPIVMGKGQMSASATWEFWSTKLDGSPLDPTKIPAHDGTTNGDVTNPPHPDGERFWVAQEVTVWGQPARGAEWIPDVNEFQNSKKFVELTPDGKVMRGKDGNILYKGSSISLVYECQTLYTDTMAPDRRDRGYLPPAPAPPSTSSRRVSDDPTPGPAPPRVSDDPPTPGPAPAEQFPHKMAWYMFLTASSGPGNNMGGEYLVPNNPPPTFKNCDDINKDNMGPQTCTNRDHTTSDYEWTPGTSLCPDATKPSTEPYPLCPNCVVSSHYQGSDGGGLLENDHHNEMNKQAATGGNGEDQKPNTGLPPCATKRDPATLDKSDSPWQNDYFSMCDFPMVASAMALPINGMYENPASATFHANGTITAGPPQDHIGGENSASPQAHSHPPGAPGGNVASSGYDGISGPVNSLMLCDGVFDHCYTNVDADGGAKFMDCGYGHTKSFLSSLDQNKRSKPGILGNVPPLVDDVTFDPNGGEPNKDPTYKQRGFATLICVRNPWIQGSGYDQTHPSKTFTETCNDKQTDNTLWMPGKGTGENPPTGPNYMSTSCMKGGGFGWPYCPNYAPNSGAIKDDPPPYSYIFPQGKNIGQKFYFLKILSARFLPVSLILLLLLLLLFLFLILLHPFHLIPGRHPGFKL